MKAIIFLLVIIGIIFIAVGYINNNLQCPPPVIQYRYIPKTFNEDQDSITPLLSIKGVRDMFEKGTPWDQTQGYNTDVVYQ